MDARIEELLKEVGTIPRPVGSRLVVVDLLSGLSIRERGKRSGITVITDEASEPKPTMGVIVALGKDPWLREEMELDVGKIVYFNKHDGLHSHLNGKKFRTLDQTMITNVLDELPEGEIKFDYKVRE